MTKSQLSEALALAKSDAEIQDSLDIFDGCALPGFQPVFVTIPAVARFLRYHALQFNGTFSPEAVNEVAQIGRTRFMVI